MKVLLTGSSGRIGRAIFARLSGAHEVIGLDRAPFSTTHIIGDCADAEILKSALYGIDAVIHTAGPHAPHVGTLADAEFERVNVDGTALLYELALASGATRFLYTSTTALYGHAIRAGECAWIDEVTAPQPKSIYHRTKLAAETLLEELATPQLPVRVLRMSRCFPERADRMASYRLHRGIDARDVASGHGLALNSMGCDSPAFDRFILSGATPFAQEDCAALAQEPRAVLKRCAPALLDAMDQRGWPIPVTIDRVYSSAKAQSELGWTPRWGWEEVLAQADRHDLEVLPAGLQTLLRPE